MRILVTGANGFIGQNLIIRLEAENTHEIMRFTRRNTALELADMVKTADFVFHLAGENRPSDISDFTVVNDQLTASLCELLLSAKRSIPVAYASSTQAEKDNPYGISKLAGEKHLIQYARESQSSVFIYRLPNVFGKWGKPDYNSVVATFCHNLINDIDLRIDDPDQMIDLAYIDYVIDELVNNISDTGSKHMRRFVEPVYSVTLQLLAEKLSNIHTARETLNVCDVGSGLMRALHATYLSYLPPSRFSYSIPVYGDQRGSFSEILKTHDSGQVSFFTANPGVTRGGHYHHSKTEKFLVVSGVAEFSFRHVLTGEKMLLSVDSSRPEIVETVPGWAHAITNTGSTQLIVLLWANEIYNADSPDTWTFNMNS